MLFYCGDECIKVGQTVDLLFRQQHIETGVLFQDNGIFEVLIIFFLEFITMQELLVQ